MDSRLTIFFCFVVAASALPQQSQSRDKRDVMESMKNAWNEVVRTLSDAGDAVVYVFKPTTEKNIILKGFDSMADGVKGFAN